MSCTNLKSVNLGETASGETWPGLTLAIDYSDDTKYADTLSLVRMSWSNSAGVVALTLSSATSAITIDSATAYAWGFTVEPRLLTLTAGTYTWAIETTDSGGVVDKDYMAGTHTILDDPHT
jgi:hypothetical protein